MPNDPLKRLAVGLVAGHFDRVCDLASGRGTPEEPPSEVSSGRRLRPVDALPHPDIRLIPTWAAGRTTMRPYDGTPMSSFHSSGFAAMKSCIIATHSASSSTTTSTPRARR